MKCSIVQRADPNFLLLRLEAETEEESEDVKELQDLDRCDELSSIASFGGCMVEVRVPRVMAKMTSKT